MKRVLLAFAVLATVASAAGQVRAGVIVTPVTSDPQLSGLAGITTDGVNLYVTKSSALGGQVFSVPIGGGAATELYRYSGQIPGQSFARAITIIGPDLFWIDSESGLGTQTQIRRAPRDGSGPMTVIYDGSAPLDGTGLTTDGTWLYAADAVQGRVYRLNPDGSGLTQIGGSRYSGLFDTERDNFIVEQDGVLYIADRGRAGIGAPPAVVSIATSGGPFTTLYSGAPLIEPYGIALAGDTLYLSELGGQGIWSLPITGGTPTLLVSDPRFGSLLNLTYYDNALYVADRAGAEGVRIWRVELAAVPEPASMTLLGFGAVVLIGYRWRRRKAVEPPARAS